MRSSPPHPDLSTILSEARTRARLTQPIVAQTCGVSTTYICDLERGRRQPSPALLARLCDLYSLDPDRMALLIGALPDDIAAYITDQPEAIRLLRALTDAQASAAVLEHITGLLSLSTLESHGKKGVRR